MSRNAGRLQRKGISNTIPRLRVDGRFIEAPFIEVVLTESVSRTFVGNSRYKIDSTVAILFNVPREFCNEATMKQP